MEPTLQAVRDALRVMALPMGAQQVRHPLLVLNEVGCSGNDDAAQVEAALEHKVDATVPFLPRVVNTGGDHGHAGGGIARRLSQRYCRSGAGGRRVDPGQRFTRVVRQTICPPNGAMMAQLRPPRPEHVEPRMNPSVAVIAPAAGRPSAEQTTTAELRNLCLLRIDPAASAALPPDRLGPEIERLVAEIATERRIQLNGREQRQVASDLVHDMLGLGPLQLLLDDETVTDIMVNGPDRVFVERGGKVTLSDVRFRDAAHVGNICQRIASSMGRRVDESSPMCDARLADGSRVNIVFTPLALDGPYISIRKFAKRRLTFERMVAGGSCVRNNWPGYWKSPDAPNSTSLFRVAPGRARPR